ncbi:MAG: hypothetical protein SFT94_12035 [Pseudanabaenaceae cyanobacterium bins.68]|nr:hypothetical protein [Pseudanabaenaceae cyanobacterium bins.68]
MDTVGFEQNKSKGKLPWLLICIVISWYLLYGLGLRATYQPLLFWLVAATTGSCLAGVVTTYQFLALSLCLGAAWGLSLPLLINTLIVRASNGFERILELYEQQGWLGVLISGASVLLLALCWYSPLFFCQRRMARNGFSRRQVFFTLAISSWVGLCLGWLIGAVAIA